MAAIAVKTGLIRSLDQHFIPAYKKEEKHTVMSCFSSFINVGATGFEPATAWSQTRCATGLRYAPKMQAFKFANAKLLVFIESCKFYIHYFMMPCSTNIFFRICTPRSTCSSVCVAINAKRTSVSCGAHAGGITELMNTPLS